MTIDETTAFPSPVPTLAVHRRCPDGSVGEFLVHAQAVTATAAVLDSEPHADNLEAPDLSAVLRAGDCEPPTPLVLVAPDGNTFDIIEVHTSTRGPQIAVEIASAELTVTEPELEEQTTLPARSVWCIIFPRMRGC